MVDMISNSRRSEIMSRVKGKDTQPEMIVRRLLHGAGFRYRLHVPNLPGKPDLVFPARKKIIFVHGCFWHMHEGCGGCRIPKTHVGFWTEKLTTNRDRDKRNIDLLKRAGWSVAVLWECELGNRDLLARLSEFLK